MVFQLNIINYVNLILNEIHSIGKFKNSYMRYILLRESPEDLNYHSDKETLNEEHD